MFFSYCSLTFLRMFSVLWLWASSDSDISLRNLLPSSLELAFFYSEDADH